jgi:hypothetical protein
MLEIFQSAQTRIQDSPDFSLTSPQTIENTQEFWKRLAFGANLTSAPRKTPCALHIPKKTTEQSEKTDGCKD